LGLLDRTLWTQGNVGGNKPLAAVGDDQARGRWRSRDCRGRRAHTDCMKRSGTEDVLAQGSAGFSITDDEQHFSMRAPLGTTRVDWLAIDGQFTESSDGTVRFRMKPECVSQRSILFRLGIRLSRSVLGFDGMRLDAARYGRTTAAALAATLNERLATRLGQLPSSADPTSGSQVQSAASGPLVRLVSPSFWVAIAVILLVVAAVRLIH
jgi:hypothetical protein